MRAVSQIGPRRIAALLGVAAATAALTACGKDASSGSPHASAAGGAATVEVVDPEARQSFAAAKRPANAASAPVPGSLKAAKTAAPDTGISPGAPSDAEVKRELKEMTQAIAKQHQELKHASVGASIAGDGKAEPPLGVPEAVARIIAGGNAIAHYPYVYGGGHASFEDTAYDCSGSVSYALAAAGLLKAPLTSGQLAHWGAPGQGRYITIFANAGHTFMYVDGLRFDTSFRSGPTGTRWQTAHRSLAGFVERHPPGL